MGSSRLPGKVLAPIAGRPSLGRLIDRLRAARSLDDIVVATTTAPGDDVLAEWCSEYGVSVFRGSEDDVLGRVVGAHREASSDIIVEINGDDPLTDPDIVDLGVDTYLAHDVDVVTNCGMVLTWPMGVYVQVFSLAALESVAQEVRDPAVREHVSLHFYENPDRFQTINLIAPACWHAPEYRFQLDYAEDLAFLEQVHQRLEPELGGLFSLEDVMALLRDAPELLDINRHCEERSAR